MTTYQGHLAMIMCDKCLTVFITLLTSVILDRWQLPDFCSLYIVKLNTAKPLPRYILTIRGQIAVKHLIVYYYSHVNAKYDH